MAELSLGGQAFVTIGTIITMAGIGWLIWGGDEPEVVAKAPVEVVTVEGITEGEALHNCRTSIEARAAVPGSVSLDIFGMKILAVPAVKAYQIRGRFTATNAFGIEKSIPYECLAFAGGEVELHIPDI